MLDEDVARIRAHRNNIHRYRRLLGTRLSDIERQCIERRLAEEETALKAMAAQTFPVAFTLQNVSRLPRALGAAVVLRLLSATADDQDREAVHSRGRKTQAAAKEAFAAPQSVRFQKL